MRSKKPMKKSPDQELLKMLEEAQKQPGVQDVMEVYRHYRMLEEVVRPHQIIEGIIRTVSLSNESGPCIRSI